MFLTCLLLWVRCIIGKKCGKIEQVAQLKDQDFERRCPVLVGQNSPHLFSEWSEIVQSNPVLIGEVTKSGQPIYFKESLQISDNLFDVEEDLTDFSFTSDRSWNEIKDMNNSAFYQSNYVVFSRLNGFQTTNKAWKPFVFEEHAAIQANLTVNNTPPAIYIGSCGRSSLTSTFLLREHYSQYHRVWFNLHDSPLSCTLISPLTMNLTRELYPSMHAFHQHTQVR